jgi:acyl carrier protein
VGGVRIEPEEIERALLTVPGIQACAVRTLDTPDNTGNLIAKEAVQKATTTQAKKINLVAYLVLGKDVTVSEIRTPLEQLLPTPAIPRSFFALPSLPLNSNGKTDYHGLTSLESATIIRDNEYKEPATSTEKMVAEVWETILQTSGVGRDDHFFSLGGDSLKAMQVINGIRKRLSSNLGITDLLKRPCLKDFCLYADCCLQTEADQSHSEWID